MSKPSGEGPRTLFTAADGGGYLGGASRSLARTSLPGLAFWIGSSRMPRTRRGGLGGCGRRHPPLLEEKGSGEPPHAAAFRCGRGYSVLGHGQKIGLVEVGAATAMSV